MMSEATAGALIIEKKESIDSAKDFAQIAPSSTSKKSSTRESMTKEGQEGAGHNMKGLSEDDPFDKVRSVRQKKGFTRPKKRGGGQQRYSFYDDEVPEVIRYLKQQFEAKQIPLRSKSVSQAQIDKCLDLVSSKLTEPVAGLKSGTIYASPQEMFETSERFKMWIGTIPEYLDNHKNLTTTLGDALKLVTNYTFGAQHQQGAGYFAYLRRHALSYPMPVGSAPERARNRAKRLSWRFWGTPTASRQHKASRLAVGVFRL